jgi:hypothetical protein
MPLAAREWLDREFLRMGQREHQQQRRQAPRAYAPVRATEIPKMDGIRLQGDKITIHGVTYGRDQFRAKLQEIVETMQSDPASAYRDRKNPNHQQTVEEISLAYKFLNNELSPQDETAIVSEWHEATQESSEVSNEQPFRQLAEMMRDPEVRIALQRAKVGQPLDAAQRQIVARHNELEAQNNQIARREQAGSGGWMSTKPPHRVPSDLYRIDKIADPREKLHAVRELRAQIRADKEHRIITRGMPIIRLQSKQ